MWRRQMTIRGHLEQCGFVRRDFRLARIGGYFATIWFRLIAQRPIRLGRSPRSSNGHPFERHEAADVVDQVLQSDLGSRSDDADRSHKALPVEVSCAPNTCSMRTRIRLFLRFASTCRSDSG